MISGREWRLALMATVLAGCGLGTRGWQGTNVHVVDGTWIGTEIPCSSGTADSDLECRTIVELTMQAIEPDLRAKVTHAAIAILPTTFVTPTGEVGTVRSAAGILTRKAVVLDLGNGSRRVIGLWCHLPYGGGNRSGFLPAEASCGIAPLIEWRDGNTPPSIPPGVNFG